MFNIPSLEEMMKAGVHFGHQRSKWHPKMKPYIFTEKNGVQIINLEETQKQLGKALEFIAKTVEQGGTVLFLGTKIQAKKIVKEAAESCKSPYIISRWLGGTLTNAPSILGLVKKFRKLRSDKASGALEKYTKKEQLLMNQEIERLEGLVGGIAELDKIPDALFIVDIREEKTAVREARRKNVPIVALCDTNTNPEKAEYPIPANDDAIKSIALLAGAVAQTIADVKSKKNEAPKTEKK